MNKEPVKITPKVVETNNSKEKKELKTDTILEKISKAILFVIVFLVPVFFLPWTSNILSFNKQALLVGLGLIALFLWLAKVLITGKLKISLSKFHIPVAIWLIVYLAAALFSKWFYGSFWGWPQATSQSFLTLLSLILFYFLAVNLLDKKEIPYLLFAFLASGFLAVLIGLSQLFGKFLLPFGFTKSVSFNTVGSINQLAFFSAVLIPLFIFAAIREKRVLRILASIALVSAVLFLAFVNLSVVWWLILGVSLLIIFFAVQRRDLLDSRWLFLPMVLLAVALFFGFFRFPIPGSPSRPIEVYLNNRTSFDIAFETIKESPILGSGPGTFVYQFSQFKDAAINSGLGWNIRFDSAGSKALNALTHTGILGAVSFLALLVSFVFFGIWHLFKKTSFKKEPSQKEWLLKVGLFIGLLAVTASFFLYNSSLVMDFTFFLLAASLLCLMAPDKKQFNFQSSSLMTFGATFAVTLIFIFSLGLLILEGQRYSAEANYREGIEKWQKGEFDAGLNNLEKAAVANSESDLYWREISQVYLQKANIDLNRKDLDKAQINQRVQVFISNAVNSAKRATNVNPENVANWSVRGFIYQNLVGVVEGTDNWAIEAYNKASELEPVNPYYPTQKGIVLLAKANLAAEDKESIFAQAENEFKKAIELKSDYAPAHYQIARLYQTKGDTEEVITKLEEIKQIAPRDVGVGFQLGLIYFRENRNLEAQIELERVIAIDPDYSNALYFLGLTYDRQGNKQKALEEFEKLLALNPNNEEVKKILENLKSGKSALAGIVEEQPEEAPIEESPPEITEEE